MQKPSIVTLAEATKNLSESVAKATELDFSLGLAWYSTAHTESFLACQSTGTDFETFCKVVAILSPATKWEQNIKAAQNLIAQYQSGAEVDNLAPCGTRYYANARKAYEVLAGARDFVKSGTGKTFSFYQNIFNPAGGEYITVDYWIYKAATKTEVTWKQWEAGEAKLNKATYSTISEAIRLVANQYNILPLQCQAISWLSEKNS